MTEFFANAGIELFKFDALMKLIIYFAMDVFFLYLVIDRIYYRLNRDKRYYFTFIMVNILIFFISSLLAGARVKTGFAFGLFAIFSILRYRTVQINSKEMTFLFISIIVAVLNSLVTDKVSIAEIVFANTAITFTAYFLEVMWLKKHDDSIRIIYEKIELIKPENREKLLMDLRERTGVNVKNVVIDKINYLRDTANIMAFYDNNGLPKGKE